VEYVRHAVVLNGYSAQQFLSQVHSVIINDPVVSDTRKALLSREISYAEANLCSGCDEYLQLLNVSSCFWKTLRDSYASQPANLIKAI
jgi:DNA polymerase III delta prime subunit